MKLGKRSRGAVALAAVVVAAATGCSTKAPESSGGGGGGEAADVQTDIGVEGTTITLGVLTDLTGVFAALGKDITNAQRAVLEGQQGLRHLRRRARRPGHRLRPPAGRAALQRDEGQHPGDAADDRLADQHRPGARSTRPTRSSTSPPPGRRPSPRSPAPASSARPTTSRSPTATTTCSSRACSRRATPSVTSTSRASTAPTAWPARKAVAEEKGLKVVEAQIKSTDQDMSAQITQFKAAGRQPDRPDRGPGQLASVAGGGRGAGSRRPDPGQQPGLRARPARRARRRTGSRRTSTSRPRCRPSTQHPDLLEEYEAAYPDATPSLGVARRRRHERDHEAGARLGLRER